MARVLILGNNDRSALASCRSLGKRGVDVDIANAGSSGVSSYSRYAGRTLDLGDPSCSVKAYLEALLDALRESTYDLLLPLTDGACLVCLEWRESIEEFTRVALPSAASFRYAHNKQLLLEDCRKIGVPVPSSTLIEEYKDALAHRNRVFPCYLKPIMSSRIIADRVVNFHVKEVGCYEELDDFARSTIPDVPILAQEVCPGAGHGVYVLAKDGEIVSAIHQRRIHEPSGGGGGSYRISCEMNQTLFGYARKLVERLHWNGVAMFEFKGDPAENRWWIMELNGRLWGSLPLTVAAGLDFPYWQYQQTLGQRIEVSSIRYGIRQRHLGKDIGWVTKRLKNPGRLKTLLEWVTDFRHVISGIERFDVEAASDPMPGLMYWWRAFSHVLGRVGRVVRRKLLLVGYRRRHREIAGLLQGRLKRKKLKVLFVCRGNICRSAFAERYLRSRYDYPDTRSGGTIPLSNRKTPRLSEKVAECHFDVNMAEHRSRTLDADLTDWADVFVVMDERNFFDVKSIVGGKPVLMLGGFLGIRNIDDPYNKIQDEYLKSYRLISRAIDRMWENG